MQINSINSMANFGVRFSKRAEAAIQKGLKEYEADPKNKGISPKVSDYRQTLNSLKNSHPEFFVDITNKDEITLKYPKIETVGYVLNNKNNEKCISNTNINEIYFAVNEILGLLE